MPGQPQRLSRSLLLALGAMLLFNLLPTLGQSAIPCYDRQTHLFFAAHYQRDWFEPWDTRWFGGFCLFSYPPLLHQLVALLGQVIGLEAAYALVQIATLVAFPAVIWLLAVDIVGAEGAEAAAWVSVPAASVYLVTYVYGMLPTLLALVLLLAALAALVRYLRGGRRLWLGAWWALGAATMAAHHFTAVAGMPLLVVGLLPACWPQDGRLRLFLGRGLLAALGMGVAGTLVILPFWWWVLTQSRPQAEIWHFTRINFLTNPHLLGLYLANLWGGSLLLAPWALREGFSRPRTRSLAALTALFFLLGLGRTSRLPQLLFPGWWRWLTYERFAFWGSVVLLIPLGAWLARQASRRQLLAGALLLACAARSATLSLRDPIGPPPLPDSMLPNLQAFFNNDRHWQYYYLTLGLGESEVARLSRLLDAPDLDGIYSTARRDLFLSQSGAGPQDVVPIGPDPQKSVLERVVLAHPLAFRLRWVLCADQRGEEMLRRTGWSRVGQFNANAYRDITRDGWGLAQLMVWEAPGGERMLPADLVNDRWPSPPVLAILWGVLPLASLAAGLSLIALAWWSDHDR